jgi:hypothetical protein
MIIPLSQLDALPMDEATLKKLCYWNAKDSLEFIQDLAATLCYGFPDRICPA